MHTLLHEEEELELEEATGEPDVGPEVSRGG